MLNVKNWPVQKVRLERSYPWVGDPDRPRIRLANRYGGGYLCLGGLHPAATASWDNSRKFLANVLHDGIIRTDLRDAVKARAG